jgi:thiosulfate dehydrogenase [quinone] large subunit
LAGLLFNLTYMFSGSAGVNSMYALASVGLIMAWRNAGWLGLDRYALPVVSTRIRANLAQRQMSHGRMPATI